MNPTTNCLSPHQIVTNYKYLANQDLYANNEHIVAKEAIHLNYDK